MYVSLHRQTTVATSVNRHNTSAPLNTYAHNTLDEDAGHFSFNSLKCENCTCRVAWRCFTDPPSSFINCTDSTRPIKYACQLLIGWSMVYLCFGTSSCLTPSSSSLSHSEKWSSHSETSFLHHQKPPFLSRSKANCKALWAALSWPS